MNEIHSPQFGDDVFRVLVVGHTYVVGLNQGKLDLIGRSGRLEIGLVVPIEWRCRETGRVYRLECASRHIRCFGLPVFFNGRSGGYLFGLRRLIAILREFRPALIHIEQEAFSLSAFQVAVLSSRMKIPFSVFCWENVERPLSPVRRWTRHYVATRARLAVAGNRAAGELLKRWGYRGDPEIMPQLGVDMELFSPSIREPMPGRFRIGYVGRLCVGKGVDVLLDACKILRDEDHVIELAVVGAGPETQRLQATATVLGLTGCVTWRGWVPHRHVPAEMASMDVLVLPSRTVPDHTEQLGHVLLEAMAMGIPVVGSSSGEIPEVIGRSDLIFPENDARRLAAILLRLMHDDRWRKEISDYGVARVRERFSNAKVAERLEAAWRKALAGCQPGKAIFETSSLGQRHCTS